MLKYILIFSLFSNTLLFSQEMTTQKDILRKEVLKKYVLKPLLFPVSTINDFLKDKTAQYESYMSSALNEDYNYQWSQSTNSSCDEVCPKNLDILKYNSYNLESTQANSLSFLNFKNYFDDIIVKEYGFCWGHASITAQFRHLAFFDPYNDAQTTQLEYNSDKWREYIKEAIKDIYYFKPRVIPYIHNIRELSELFEDQLKNRVIKKWADNAVSIKNYFDRFDNENLYKREEIQAMMLELEKRINSGQIPEIIFNIWESHDWIHVALVRQLYYNQYDDTYTLYLDDNKVFNNASSLSAFESTIKIDLKDKSIIYNNGDRFKAPSPIIGRLALTQANYELYNKILPRLKLFCEKYSGCSKN